ncbi:ADK-domain-containing protein [Calocera viscosa TUFC12733]|uniref:ADK-domain-containing protein n=1 Tax=Calocera viscosa (strain TUFC12733) TaxID=1330018 RepID=A0A167LLX7_CALVF|nr:ADK-domain-containing protein [Calocera viscosa TUFC12733]
MPLLAPRRLLASSPSPSPSAVPLVRTLTTSPSAHKAAAHLFDVAGATTYPPSHPTSPSHSHAPHGSPAHPLRLVMFGKPGSGKGTLSTLLTSHYALPPISTGDSLRRQIALRTPLGQRAEALVASGTFLPDETMLDVVQSELDPLRGSWLLDGFPRTVPQARMLDAYLASRAPPAPLTLVVHLDVPDAVILERIRDRWVHLPSGRVYNLAYNPPLHPGVDDLTGEELTKRPDDTPEVFARRLEVFGRETAPLMSYYADGEGKRKGEARVVSLKGETSDEIWPLLEREVRGFDLPLRTGQGEGQEGRRVDEEVIRMAEKEEGAEGVSVSALR